MYQIDDDTVRQLLFKVERNCTLALDQLYLGKVNYMEAKAQISETVTNAIVAVNHYPEQYQG